MSEFNRDEMEAALKAGTYKVSFVKNNGDKRVMTCTLQADMLPLMEDTGKAKRPVNEEILAVWDVDADGWRAFRVDSVYAFSE